MNHELFQLEKLSEALHATLRQLAQEDTLSMIDRDLLKHQCLLLYEKIAALETATPPAPVAPVEVAPVEVLPAIVELPAVATEAPAVTEETKPEPVVETAPVPEIPVNLFQQPLFEKELTLNDLAEATETPILKVPPTETEIRNSVIDQIVEQQHQPAVEKPVAPADPELTLHEKIAHSIDTKNNLIDKLSASIPSLKNAINVNLKIALVGQLFNDNTVEYVKAIDKLNSCENIHEAMRYFNELKHQYGWDSENHNVKELEQLLNKRYHS